MPELIDVPFSWVLEYILLMLECFPCAETVVEQFGSSKNSFILSTYVPGASKPGVHRAPTFLLKILCFTIDTLFLEEGAMKDHFPFVHIPKALNMMPTQIHGAVWKTNKFSCPSVI